MDDYFNSDVSLMYFDIFDVVKKDCSPVLDIVLKNLSFYNFEVNKRDENGNTILHISTAKGNATTVKKILEVGADTNIYNNSKDTPLHLACKQNNSTVFKLLINYPETNLFLLNNSGENVAFQAVRLGKYEFLKTLITKEKNLLTTHNRLDENLLHYCIRPNTDESNRNLIVQLLLQSPTIDINKTNLEHLTPLQMTIINGYEDLTITFLDSGANKTVLTYEKNSLLHLAAIYNRTKVAEVLIKHGMEINSVNNDLMSPLHLAVEYNHVEMVKLLISFNGDVNAKEFDDYTPIHLATKDSNWLNCLRALLEDNANLNLVTYSGNTALHLACLAGNLDAVRFLYRLNLTKRENNDGFTPVQLAQEMKHDKIVEFLQSRVRRTSIPVAKYKRNSFHF